MIILGIDPGSRSTGYGIVEVNGPESRYLADGCIRPPSNDLGERLQHIFLTVQALVQRYKPQEAAIEQVFMHQNPNSALKLGQARGAAIVGLSMPVAEYSARQVKQSVVGQGAATKEQVQHMVLRLLNISHTLQADAADALAIALCHAHVRACLYKARRRTHRQRTASWRNYQPTE